MGLFDDLDRQSDAYLEGLNRFQSKPMRAPFPYPGGKSKSAAKILPLLPYRDSYIEPFGGSFAVGLNRAKSPLEVYNDRFGGVVAFYRCIRDKKKCEALQERLDLTIGAKEEFYWCKETWEEDHLDDVERAARWYYMVSYSFGGLCRNWGRMTKDTVSTFAGKIRNTIKMFPQVHERMRFVQVENADWREILRDYDKPDAVFYLDPPYVDTHGGTYKNELTVEDHRELINTVFNCKGFVAVSGYENPLYNNQEWDHKYTWKASVSISACAYTEGNNKKHLEGLDKRSTATECLWVKEAES